MTREEAERNAHVSEQLDGSAGGTPHRESSFPFSRRSTDKTSNRDRRSLDQKSTDKVIDKAEKQAHKTEKEGATEEPQRDRTLASVRSPSAERTGGTAGATLPVVQEDGEGGSREESIKDEKSAAPTFQSRPRPDVTKEKNASPNDSGLPSIPKFNRLSLGLGPSSPTMVEHAN